MFAFACVILFAGYSKQNGLFEIGIQIATIFNLNFAFTPIYVCHITLKKLCVISARTVCAKLGAASTLVK